MKKVLMAVSMSLAFGAAQAADIVDTAKSAGNFNTLVTAIEAAGLVDTLKGPGPFTVFAPTDKAFAKIPKAKLDALLKDKAALTKVLTYHVVPARVLKAELPVNTAIATVQGQSFTVNASLVITDQTLRTSGLAATDVFTSNGVIHVVDRVLLPR